MFRRFIAATIIGMVWFVADAYASHSVSFDMSPMAAGVMSDRQSMQVHLRLSALVSPNAPSIDHWMVRVVPRHVGWTVDDYSPRTETASTMTSPIEIQATEESTRSSGISGDVAYGHLVRGQLGADRGGKHAQTWTIQRHAPIEAVTASGTIERGRGVYFKMNWTAQQVLEGEKEFSIAFEVPSGCRGGVLDVTVSAHRQESDDDSKWMEIPVIGSAGDHSGSRDVQRVAHQHFAVAVYRDGDEQAQALAAELTATEFTLRSAAADTRPTPSIRSLPGLLRHVAAKFNADEMVDPIWIDRFIAGVADPYVDPAITKLPSNVRVLALDYADLRRQLTRLRDQPPVTVSPLSSR
ncbi:MAG: hypothetical protein AAGJ40_22605 [Planctomycetota bacterium]